MKTGRQTPRLKLQSVENGKVDGGPLGRVLLNGTVPRFRNLEGWEVGLFCKQVGSRQVWRPKLSKGVGRQWGQWLRAGCRPRSTVCRGRRRDGIHWAAALWRRRR
jgi:hypothetical protein